MPSVREIAEGAGVSITTVSRALNNDPAVSERTRNRVLAVANRTGYVQTVGRRITTNVALVYTQEVTLSHPFDSAVLEGIYRGVDQHRFDVVLLNIQRDKSRHETFTQFFMRKGVRGVILRTMAGTRDTCQAIADEGFPHIVISERFESPNVNCIDVNSQPESVRAVEYLVDLGHRRIAFAMHNIPDRDHLDRLEGYRQALRNHGLLVEDRLIFRQPFTLAGGASVMQMVMSMHDRPTAIFLADPLLGVGAVKMAHELGVEIPSDISVVGFDDTDVRHSVTPTLTAICQDAASLGFEASRWLTHAIVRGSRAPFKKTQTAFFEVNQSTACPPDAARQGNGTHWSVRGANRGSVNTGAGAHIALAAGESD
jgi:DNA-binding LacI/PurR family transcriptional regulator